ncbi:MAG: diguanylate cyclase domain-containing protein [Bacillota bacterium]
MKSNLLRVSEAMDNELEELGGINFEYSRWDDTYNFVEKRNQSYIESNFGDLSSFAKFRISFMLMLDNNGKVVITRGYDFDEAREIAVSDTIIEQLFTYEKIIYHTDKDKSVAGYIDTKHGPVMLVSNPIVNTHGDGPVRGTLIFGRILKESEFLRISKATQLNIRAYSYNDANVTKDIVTAKEKLSKSGSFYISPLNSYTIAGYNLINDINGKPCIVLKTDSSREIYNQGKAGVFYYIIILAAVGLIICLIIMLLLKRILLSRLTKLSNTTFSISESGDLSLRMYDTSNDELSKLIKSVNGMLDTLEKAQNSIMESESKFRSLFENMTEGFTYNELMADENGLPYDIMIHEANDAFVEYFGLKLDRAELKGKKLSELPHLVRDYHLELLPIFGSLAVGESKKVDEFYAAELNKWYSISVYSIKQSYFAAIYNDITDAKLAEAQMQKIAYHDSLTDLPNRKLFYDKLDSIFEYSKLHNEKFAVLFIDLNNFKSVNDTLGHDAGDRLLKETAIQLNKLVRNEDLVARLGGDEFIIIQQHVSKREDAEILANRIISNVRFVLDTGSKLLHVDTSVGVSIFPEDADDIQNLIKKADMAMYDLKSSMNTAKE